MKIESAADFWILIALLAAAGAIYFPLARLAINRLAAWIMNIKWRRT